MTKLNITKPIRLIELFGGVGAQAMALRDVGANFERYRYVDFDKYAVKSYNAIHGTDFPVIDITQFTGDDLGIVDTDKYCYIMFYSFPCQDLSVSGRGKGMNEGSGTRSALLWECKRLLQETKNLPQILMMENVPQVHSKKNVDNFQKWLDFLTSLGYTTIWHDMNAKDYGVAQSRNRTIAVSFLGDYEFDFPKPIPLTKRLKDYLEEKVDEKFYLTSDKARTLIDKLIKEDRLPMSTKTVKLTGWNSNHLTPDAEENDVACTLMARDWKGPSNYGYNGVIEVNE